MQKFDYRHRESTGFLWRFVSTAIIVAVYGLLAHLFDAGKSGQENSVPAIAFWVMMVILAVMWLPWIWKYLPCLPDFGDLDLDD